MKKILSLMFLLLTELVFSQEKCLDIKIIPYKESLVVGEPLFVRSIIKSECEAVVKAVAVNSPTITGSKGLLNFFISSDNVEFENWTTKYQSHSIDNNRAKSEGRVEIEKGVYIEQAYRLYYQKSKGVIFNRKGKYYVKGAFKTDANAVLFSNVISVDVEYPKGKDGVFWENVLSKDLKLQKLIQFPKEYYQDLWALRKDNMLKGVVEVCLSSEDSVYIPYLAHSLLSMPAYSQNRKLFAKGMNNKTNFLHKHLLKSDIFLGSSVERKIENTVQKFVEYWNRGDSVGLRGLFYERYYLERKFESKTSLKDLIIPQSIDRSTKIELVLKPQIKVKRYGQRESVASLQYRIRMRSKEGQFIQYNKLQFSFTQELDRWKIYSLEFRRERI